MGWTMVHPIFFAGKMRYAKGGTIDSIIASQKGRSTIKQ